MADFAVAYEKTMLAEGGYRLTNDPRDTGGMTYAGISRRWNPQWMGWSYVDRGEIPPTPLVRGLYHDKYWSVLTLTEVSSQEVAEAIYDFGVNASPTISAKLAQVVIGATPDGKIGPKTVAALNSMSDPALFLARFALAKIARYRDIVTKDRKQGVFLLGWINRTLSGVA